MQPKTSTGFQLSPQQERLWSLQQDEQDFRYRAQCAVRIDGPLDVKILKAAIESVVNRHEILRTSFDRWSPLSAPVQVISDQCPPSLTEYSLGQLNSASREARLEDLYGEIEEVPFGPDRSAPLRITLLKLSDVEHRLFLSASALSLDAPALRLTVNKISRAYAASLNCEEVTEEALQYADLAEWQRELLEGKETEIGRNYWRKNDVHVLLDPTLPCGARSDAASIFKPSVFATTFTAGLAAGIESLSRKHETTTEMVLLACWKIFLWRLISKSELTVGVACDGRTDEELKTVPGLFTKYVPLHFRLQSDFKFGDVLSQSIETARENNKWQLCFTWEQFGASNVKPTSLTFFPICFDFESFPTEFSVADLTFSFYKQYACTDRFNLKFTGIQNGECLHAEFHYDSSSYCAEAIEQLAGQFHQLVESIVDAPETAIGKLKMITAVERHRLLFEFNDTKFDYADDKCLHQLFEMQAAKSPGAVAVVYEDEAVTYEELNGRANQLAHRLRALGVGPEVVVGLMVERSVEMVVGLLGILKAGAAYLPLDPEYPTERLAFMQADAGVKVLVTQERLRGRLASEQAQVLMLDGAEASVRSVAEWENPAVEVSAENLAYVIYTSGSSGQPKGVLITHAAVTRLFAATRPLFEFSGKDVWSLFHSYAFDFSVWEIWGALLHGGRLVVVPYLVSRAPAALVQWLHEQRVTVLNQTPTAFRQLQPELLGQGVGERLRLVIFGGEALECVQLGEWFGAQGDEYPQLVNMYGITETTVHVTQRRMRDADVLQGRRSLLGRAFADRRAYVLGEEQELLPVGVVGELYVSGGGVARGYLKQPALTAEKFLPDGFSSTPGGRLYRTGDLARYLANGELEYIGRRDEQIKLRGYRIELGEIEAVLGAHQAVRQAVVLHSESEPSESRLVGFVVLEQAGTVSGQQLREYAGEQLPEYMVPAVVMELEQLPVTSNGKIDRRALAVMAAAVKAQATVAYVAPRTRVERAVSEIWAEVLGVERVGLEDNFFDLGGHSLLATQVVSRLREEYGVELGVRRLFEEQTVRGLAQAIERESGEAKVERKIRIGERGEGGELPLSFAQQRLWFMNKVHPTSSFYNIPLAVRLSGPLRVAALEKTLGEIIRRHESLRTRFDEVNGRPVQVIEAANQFQLPLIDLRGLPDDQRESDFRSLMNEQANRPFDLRNGPVVRASLLQLNDEEHVVLWTMHHVVSDGWSIGVLIREVATLYEAFATGKASPLPELSVQYTDFSQWQRQRFSGTFLADQLDFWKKRLEDAPPVLELMTDRPRPATPSFSGASLPLEFSEELSTELRKLSRQEGATLFMVLLAAYQTLLHRYTRQEDILVATSIANRNSAELEQLIGFFVNTLVMRVDLSGDKTFRELVREVREIALDAYAHQDLPFEKLVEELHPEREFNRNPLAHLFFSLQNAPISELKLLDLRLAPEGFESSTTRFDLELNLWERPQVISGQMTYSTDLFEEATIKRMLHYFEVLLQAIVANPDQHLSALPLLTETECERLLKERVTPRIEYPQGLCIHHLFEAQVEKMPEAVALISDEESVTYVELNRRANKLACYLRKRGIGPEAMVGLLMRRSVEMVVGLLGILKAGGAYVPLDPKYPKQRLEFMLEDTGVQLLLTQEHMLEKLPATLLEIICLDTEWEQMDHECEENPDIPLTADNLAYVTYTSGSTGTPKGTLIPHRAVAGYMFGVDYMQFDAHQTFIHYSSPSWDTLTFELWTPLLHGARCVLYSPDFPSPEELGHVLKKHGVTVLWQTSSLFNLTIDSMPEAFSGVKQLVTGGETLSVSHIRRALTLAPAIRLVNGLGPSECTVFSLCYVIPQNLPEHLHTIPVGKPVGDRRVYLLDDHLRPVAIGIPGELYVGGPSVSRGYLNLAELTAERFVPDPFSDEPGARLYKSGDLMRYLPDGNIEFLGRVDDQVKVRGFRIEVKEIESVLGTHPGVRESVVIVREDSPGDKRLVAYVATHGSPEQSEQERAGWQNKRLSEWQMIYDDLYSRFSPQDDPTFNIKGWNSFYTGEPIPADEMRVWRDTTVERILSLKPRNVLEVGCGSGLLLFQIAPHCAKYWATDFSQTPLDYVRKHLAPGGRQLSQVRLLQRAATNFEGIEAGSFDVVILNSIVQYFPDLDYLLRVVAGAIKVLQPGGFIFLGDLRDLSLLKVFHTSLQLFQADTAESTDELWQRVQRAVDQEEELFIDSGIFAKLREYLPQIGRVDVRLQRGKHLNELNRFRFDAVLHVGEPQRIHECPYVDWQPELALHDIRDLLIEKEPEEFGLRHVPNARVEADVRAVEMLNDDEVPGSVGEFREALKTSVYNGVDPETMWALSEELPYLVEVRPSDDHGGRYFDVIFKRRLRASSTSSNGSFPTIPTKLSRLKPLSHYANYPLRGMLARHLIPQLRSFLSEKLPEYMLPSVFVVLDALPRSHNGKIDRRALPAPVQGRRDLGEDFVAPRTPVEEVLADIWREVLGVEQISVHESFFDIGGHSLLATQVLSRVHNIFRVELPLSKLFEATTIAELANAVVTHDAKPGQTEKIANIMKKIKGMSPELLKETLQHKKGEARYEH